MYYQHHTSRHWMAPGTAEIICVTQDLHPTSTIQHWQRYPARVVCCPYSDLRLIERRKDLGDATGRMKRLEADYTWVVQEKANFGKGEYDFTNQDVDKIFKDYDESEEKLKQLKERGVQRQASATCVSTMRDHECCSYLCCAS